MIKTTTNSLNRRDLFKTSGFITAGLLAGCGTTSVNMVRRDGKDPFKYCLNTSTIRGQNLPVTEGGPSRPAKAGWPRPIGEG